MSFATAAMFMKGAGAINSVVGGYYGAASQKSSLELAADLDEINARISERAAQGELLRGEREYQASRLRTAALKSRQRVAMAANGIDLSEGTAVNVLTSTDYIGEVDANEIRANAVKAAWGYRTQASNSLSSATMRRASASGINPTMSAFSNAAVAGADFYFSGRKLGMFKTDIEKANETSDPIQSMNKSRGWTETQDEKPSGLFW